MGKIQGCLINATEKTLHLDRRQSIRHLPLGKTLSFTIPHRTKDTANEHIS